MPGHNHRPKTKPDHLTEYFTYQASGSTENTHYIGWMKENQLYFATALDRFVPKELSDLLETFRLVHQHYQKNLQEEEWQNRRVSEGQAFTVTWRQADEVLPARDAGARHPRKQVKCCTVTVTVSFRMSYTGQNRRYLLTWSMLTYHHRARATRLGRSKPGQSTSGSNQGESSATARVSERSKGGKLLVVESSPEIDAAHVDTLQESKPHLSR